MLSLENIRSVFKTSPSAWIIMYPDAPRFTIAEANEAFLSITNTERTDIIGKGIFEAFPKNPDDIGSKRLKVIKASLEHALYLKKSYNIGLQRYDLPLKNSKKFDLRFWNCDTFPLLDENNNVQFIVQNPVDVTNRIMTLNEQNTLNNKLLIESNFQNLLFNDYPDAIFSLDLKGNFLSVNKVLVGLTECTKEELLQLSFIPFLAPEDFEKGFNYFQKAIKGEIQNFDANLITAKGNARVLNITNLPIVINQEVIGIYGIAKDITDIKKTEKQLDEYHKKISTIFESITDAFCAVDRNWTVTYWNKEAEQLLFMPRENIVAKNLWEVYPDAIPLECYTEYHRAMSEHISVRFDQYFPPLNIWFEISVFPSGDGLSIYFKNITKRKNAEEQLKLEKERYRNLFNLSPLPQWVYDTETLRFLYVNEAAITHYGYSKEEFLSMTIKDIRPAEDVEILKEIISTQVKTGAFNRSKARHRKKNGELIFVNVESNPISFEGKSARLVIAIDNTKKLKAIQALEASEERFNIVSKATSDAIWDLDILSGKVVWNKGIKGIFGYKQVSLTQEWWYNKVHP